jgi:hypothetical protein
MESQPRPDLTRSSQKNSYSYTNAILMLSDRFFLESFLLITYELGNQRGKGGYFHQVGIYEICCPDNWGLSSKFFGVCD